jgi:protein gp37
MSDLFHEAAADAWRVERIRFLSIEPLIGPIGPLDLVGIDWIIVGGESGAAARRRA